MIKTTKPLLIFPRNVIENYEKYPPLGLLYIASYLRSKNILSDIIDFNISHKDFKRVDYNQYGAVCLSTNILNIKNALKIANYIKSFNKDMEIIIGGPYATSYPLGLIDNSDIDAVVVGEGEHTVHEYLTKKNKSRIRGLYFKDGGGKSIFTGKREWLKNLDELLFPALDMVNLNKYIAPYAKAYPLSSIITSRGCPYNCIFCFHTLGYQWRARSSENVVKEIEWQVNELGVREIVVQDDNFTLDMDRAKEICDLITRKKIKVKLQFLNGIRVDKLDKELLIKLHNVGTWAIAVAPETGSPETLKRIKKGFNLEQVNRVIKWCKEIGIITFGHFLIGFPFETEEDFQKTTDYAIKSGINFPHIYRVIPYKGTELFDISQQKQFTDEQINYHSNPKSDRIDYFRMKLHKGVYYRCKRICLYARTLSLRSLIILIKIAIRKNLSQKLYK